MIITVDFDVTRMAERFLRNSRAAQAWLDNEVLKDCTPYVPRITGELERSGIEGTVIGSGKVVYNKLYARAQYYGHFRHSTQSHPRATREWFEVAKAVNKAKWLRGVRQLGGRA